jgi:hypothetical protein
MTPGEVLPDPKPPGLSAEQALPIARLDAEAAYGDLDDFRITIALQPWMQCAVAGLTTSSMHGAARSWPSGMNVSKCVPRQGFSAWQFTASACLPCPLASPVPLPPLASQRRAAVPSRKRFRLLDFLAALVQSESPSTTACAEPMSFRLPPASRVRRS